jgi:WD40 repeat protein
MLRVWNVEDATEIYAFRGHAGPILGVTFSPDGRRLASSGKDKRCEWELKD